MKTSRRSLFGWLAGAVGAAPAVAEAAVPSAHVAPGPFLGEIKVRHAFYGTRETAHGASEPVAFHVYEQWDGKDWVKIGGGCLPYSRTAVDGCHTSSFRIHD